MNLFGLLKEKGIIDAATAEKLEVRILEDGIEEEKALLEAGIDLEVVRKQIGEYYDLPVEEIKENIIIVH